MGRGSRALLSVALGALALWSGPAPAYAEKVKETHELLGARLDLTVESSDADAGHLRIRDAVALGRRLEAELSSSVEGSALSLLNANAGLGFRQVPLDLYRLLALSQWMTRSTGGAFDVTVAPLLRRRALAAEDGAPGFDVDAALLLVGAERIELQAPDRARLADAGMAVEFRAILDGYVLERMAAMLRAAGVVKAILQFGDETVLAIGPPPGEEPFRVRVARGRSMAGAVALRDRSLSTSRVRRRSEDGGRPPIVDPRSGRFIESDRQATVIARDAAIAEAWSTALVVDPDGALGFLDEPRDVEALVFDEHGEHRSARFDETAGWKPARAGDARERD
jgi:thiamine biosynthesis lipoprotein